MAILDHAGDHWSGDIRDLFLRCPIGYDVETWNETSYGVTHIGLRSSHLVNSVHRPKISTSLDC